MTHTLGFVDRIEDTGAFQALLEEYYAVVLKILEEAGGPALCPREQAAKSMVQNADYLPPSGRTVLAHDADGRLIGCGSLRRTRPDAVEMKRMFVRPEAQGQGLGRRLFQVRIDAARSMGCKVIHADTVKGNRSMLKIYESCGFRYIDRYAENANPEEFAPHLVFLEYRLD